MHKRFRVHADVLCPTSYRATPLHPLKHPRTSNTTHAEVTSLTHPHPHSPRNSGKSELRTKALYVPGSNYNTPTQTRMRTKAEDRQV